MRNLALMLLAVVGCTSTPNPNDGSDPGTPVSLTGNWQGTASNDIVQSFVFATDESFQFGAVGDAGFSPLMTGTYTATTTKLTLDLEMVADEDGPLMPTSGELITQPYVTSSRMCGSAFYPSGAPDGVVATWATTTTMADADGNPTNVETETIQLSADGTEVHTSSDGVDNGTYSLSGDTVTLVVDNGDGVQSVEAFDLVDGKVLCNPVYTLFVQL